MFSPFLDEVWSKKEEIEQAGLVKHEPPTATSYQQWNDGLPAGSSQFVRQDAVTDETSHYAHLSQFASGWPVNKTSPDIAKKSTTRQDSFVSDVGNGAFQKTPPQILTYNRMLSIQSKPSSSKNRLVSSALSTTCLF